MIKIDPLVSRDKAKLRKSRKKESSKTSGVSFSSTLESVVETETENAVQGLLDDLKDHERRFLDSQSLYELEKYKRKVKEILKMITDNGMETQVLRRRRSLNKADFVIIKQIDDKLHSLTKMISGPDNKAFSLMKQLEEIRGLILDLSY